MREDGYYWVKINDTDDWEVALFSSQRWWIINNYDWETDSHFDKINEERIKSPDEKN